MAKLTFIVSDESVNDRGYRILTDGIDTAQFERNPIMLLMHSRFNKEDTGVIGRWENLRKEDGKLLADAVFDTDDELGAKIEKKVKKGFLRMASISVKPNETRTEPEYLLEGQTYATVSKSKLIEISIVDRGGNDGALKLYSANGKDDYQLEKLSSSKHPEKQTKTPEKLSNTMDINKLKTELGLSATATDADILAKVQSLSASEQAFKDSQEAEKERQRLKAKEMLEPLKLSAEEHGEYMELAKTNFSLFEKHMGRLKLSADSKKVGEFLGGLSTKTKETENAELKAKGFEWLSQNKPEYLANLRANDPETFKAIVTEFENS